MSKPVIRCRVQFNGGTDFTKKFGLEPGGRVQKAIDYGVIKWNALYMAFKTGTLANSAYFATNIGSGEVVYPVPYAHYMEKGEVYGPNIPVFEDSSGTPTRFFSPPGRKKHPTGRALNYDTSRNPLAGPTSFERMKRDHVQDILQEAKDAAEKGG